MRSPKTPAGDLREACVREALVIIGDTGIESLSLREVARRLGVSHQAPYRHFASRDHLLAEIVRRSLAEFAAALDARPVSDDPHQDLGAMGQAYLRYALEFPLHYRLMFGAVLPDTNMHPEMMQSGARAFSLLREVLFRLHGGHRQKGAKKAAELDALYVWATMHGLASLMQTQAMNTAGLSQQALASAVDHVMARIGTGISGGKLS